MIQQENCTIIIPHLGESPEAEYAITQCYRSLRDTVNCPILVVKNGLVPCKHSEGAWDIYVTYQGQCKAVNAAVATVNTKYILVTNDDMVYPPGWFERLVEPLDEEEIICVSPKLIEPRDGAPTFEKYFCGGAGGDFDREKWLEFASNYPKTDFPMRTGFNMPLLISKELWDLVGGYDINYDPWGSNSDSDLEYKIKLTGVQPRQNQNCVVYHFSQTSGTFEPRNQEYWNKNWQYFIDKWGFPRTDDRIWEADFTIPDPPIRKFEPWWEHFYDDEFWLPDIGMLIERPRES